MQTGPVATRPGLQRSGRGRIRLPAGPLGDRGLGTPYILAGLAVALAFKGGLFNIGAEGQLALGALAAAWVGFGLPEIVGPMPGFIHVPLALWAGCWPARCGAASPAGSRRAPAAHEVINTIMMNYLALLLASYLLNGPWKDPQPPERRRPDAAHRRQRPG